MGFVLTHEEAQRLIDRDPKNRDVLFPYINGEDLNSRPDQSPSRWVINFFDWPLDRDSAPEGCGGQVAADYPDCLVIVEEKVIPERMKNNRKVYRDRWWHYAEKRPELYRTIARMEQVIICSRVSAHHFMTFVSTRQVFADRLVVLAIQEWDRLSCLSSSLHDAWAHRPGATTHETRNTYFNEHAFETYCFPTEAVCLLGVGQSYSDHRRQVMSHGQRGLRDTYNLFHDADESTAGIQQLRDLHVAMDQAVAATYGWTDLDLGHGFHETKQGFRFTISDPARREVLARLLRLNHERYAEEEAQGLHDQKGKAKTPKTGRGRKSRASSGGALPFGDDNGDPDPTDGADRVVSSS
jgi:hypothetical protein